MNSTIRVSGHYGRPLRQAWGRIGGREMGVDQVPANTQSGVHRGGELVLRPI